MTDHILAALQEDIKERIATETGHSRSIQKPTK
jgi:hypothetical protein